MPFAMHMSEAQVHSDAPLSVQRRPYRSRRNRPCSRCRARKILCRREAEHDTSCISCRKTVTHCSFAEKPPDYRGTAESGRDDIHEVRLEQDAQLADERVAQYMSNTEPVNGQQNLMWDPAHENFDLGMGIDCINEEVLMDTMHPSNVFDAIRPNTSAASWHEHSRVPSQMQTTISASQNPNGDHDSRSHRGLQVARISESVTPGASWYQEPPVAEMHSYHHPSSEAMSASSTPTAVSVKNAECSNTRSVDEDRSRSGYLSIDQREGFYGFHVGLSGETDPFLHRHLLYKNSGEFLFLKHMHRAVTAKKGQQTSNSTDETPVSSPGLGSTSSAPIPMQFFFTSNDLGEHAKKLGPIQLTEADHTAQRSLDHLVDPADGKRLILLFINYVFPALPVISRSQLERFILLPYSISSEGVQSFPPYLLAAIYASAASFGAYDKHLCLSKIWENFSSDGLWEIAFNGISVEMHAPRLATISAAILYLNKAPTGIQLRSTDSPAVWAFMALTVALTTSLGLQLDCNKWDIPNWEKRLRRRLWWIVYAEEKWRSLLMGRPSLIAIDQWSVSDLVADDFVIDKSPGFQSQPKEIETFLRLLESIRTSSDSGVFCQHLTSLARIVDDVYTSLYTIKATQSLADNLPKSIDVVRPLRERLTVWYRNLPPGLQLHKRNRAETKILVNSNPCLHFAYMVVEIFIYRALMRPLGDVDLDDQKQEQGEHLRSFLGQTEAILSAAENCASLVTSFVEELMSRDLTGFWYSWSRIGFATASNFITILLVQAPSVEHATTSKGLVDNWRQTLTHQSRSFPYMNLGLVRMNAMHWSDLKIFKMNKHAETVSST